MDGWIGACERKGSTLGQSIAGTWVMRKSHSWQSLLCVVTVEPSIMALGPTPMEVHRWSSSNTFWLRFVSIVPWAVDANTADTARIFHIIALDYRKIL